MTLENYNYRTDPYKAVLSPDFSMYREMSPTIQHYNTFRNRFCGAYFASKGLRVIPTVSWGDEDTFDFCFLGIPQRKHCSRFNLYGIRTRKPYRPKRFFLKRV